MFACYFSREAKQPCVLTCISCAIICNECKSAYGKVNYIIMTWRLLSRKTSVSVYGHPVTSCANCDDKAVFLNAHSQIVRFPRIVTQTDHFRLSRLTVFLSLSPSLSLSLYVSGDKEAVS